MTAPRVSVIIPVYNLARFVGQAIDSVLAQTVPREQIEIVVVDDGSTDGTADVVRGFLPHVRCIRQDNRGLCAARNAGIRASRAPFLAFLDADDRFLPDKLAAQLAVFDARSDVGLVYTGFRYVDEAGALLPQTGWARLEGALFGDLVLGNIIHPHLALVRREPVERVGAFDEDLSPAADWDLWLRLSRTGLRWACVDRALAEYRVRPDAMHQDVGRMHRDCLRVLEKAFADPELPPAVTALKPVAYRRAHLVAACDHYRVGDRNAGARWMREAARAEPSFLVDPAMLRLVCRWFLPLGYRRGTVMSAELPRLVALLRTALGDLFAAPDLEPEIARLRWPARLAAIRALLPVARKRAQAAVRRRWTGAASSQA